MKTHIRLFLAALTLIAAMNAFNSCKKDNTVNPAGKPGQEDIYVNVEFQPIVLGGERGSVATASYSVKTNLDSSEPFVLSLKENPYFKLEGKTVTALRKNVSEKDRTDTLLLTHPHLRNFAYKIPLAQKSLPRPENLVDFKCEALKAALVGRFDSDYDGEISTDEALAVEEIDIRACGVTDLTGIGAFKKAWKLDARDNDIVDGTDIKGMRQLYWLDLKGNRNLATFDITGCTIYFEWFDFEVTENLKYYLLKNQVQKEPLTIPHTSVEVAKYFHRVTDTRETKDWSRHNELTLIAEHTKGEGIPIVFYSYSMLDEDIKDGSFKRMMRDLIIMSFDETPENKAVKDYFDIYMYSHIRPNRNEWPVWEVEGDEYKQYLTEWGKIIEKTTTECQYKLFPTQPNKYIIMASADITSWGKGNVCGSLWFPGYNCDAMVMLTQASSANNDEIFAYYGVRSLRECVNQLYYRIYDFDLVKYYMQSFKD